MPRAKLICKACGKEYEACSTPNPLRVFRWFDVACSRECAQKYIRDVMIARGEIVEDEKDGDKSTEIIGEAKGDDGAKVNRTATPAQKNGKGKKD